MSLFVDSKKCTGCAFCLSTCPVEAIAVIQNKAVIDNNKCTECLKCINECPVNAIYQILDKEVSVVKRENSIPHLINPPQPKQTFWTEKPKQPAIELGNIFLSGMKKLANNFFRNEPTFGRRKRGRGKGPGRHGRRYGKGRH